MLNLKLDCSDTEICYHGTCAFISRQEFNELKEQLHALAAKGKPEVAAVSAFAATFCQESLLITTGKVVLYNKILRQIGDVGFSTKSGTYTAPRDGLYSFDLDFFIYNHNIPAYMSIRKNGEDFVTCYNEAMGPVGGASCSSWIDLKKGDHVNVVPDLIQPFRSERLDSKYRLNVFSGYLIHAL